ncbi:hypothetical protein BVI1335_1520019 [Burkholderia vietnamiensis]|nr:hypothetical protein BVI1335_1520019 [Burkholderia vietnamiensis]
MFHGLYDETPQIRHSDIYFIQTSKQCCPRKFHIEWSRVGLPSAEKITPALSEFYSCIPELRLCHLEKSIADALL